MEAVELQPAYLDVKGPGITQRVAVGFEPLTVGRHSQNMLVLKTPPSGAQPLAAAMDAAKFPEIAGTIAGDDTVLIITPNKKQRESLQQKVESFVGRPLRSRAS